MSSKCLQTSIASRLGASLATLVLAAPAVAQTREGIGMAEPRPPGSERVVTQDEWAHDLAGALGLGDVLPADAPPEDLYGLLCADQAEMTTDAGGRRVPAREAFQVSAQVPAGRRVGEPVRVIVDVPGTALYQLTVEGTGLQRWSVDRQTVGHLDVTPLGVAFGPRVLALRQGPHELAAYMNTRARAARVELSALRPLCIAPASGWRSGRPLTFGAKARTMVRSLGLERLLPEDGDAKVVEGEDFVSATAWGGRAREPSSGASGEGWATAGQSPAEFAYRVDLVQPGIYSVLARLRGGGPQIWSIDGRQRGAVESTAAADSFAWSHVMTTGLGGGEHVIRALVPRGSGIDVIRVVRRRSSDADYVDVLEGLGFHEGDASRYVTVTAAHSNLANPVFLQLSSDFLTRIAVGGAPPPLIAIENELDRLYTRPLSPVLPPEL